jgi:hypothetical protein
VCTNFSQESTIYSYEVSINVTVDLI